MDFSLKVLYVWNDRKENFDNVKKLQFPLLVTFMLALGLALVGFVVSLFRVA